MFANPILRRELTRTLRAPLTRALAAAYIAALAALLWWMWPQAGIFSRAAQTSRSILLVVTVTQMLLVILFAPAFAATALTSEKEQNSYDLLLTTLLRPSEIVLGKLLASVLCLVLFVALSAPFFAACFFLGAVSPTETMIIYLLIVASAVFGGLLGLCVSAVVESSSTALMVTYLLLLALLAGPWFPYLVFQNGTVAAATIAQVRAISPLGALAAVLVPAFHPVNGGTAGWQLYLGFVGAVGGALLLFLLGTAWLTGGRPARRHEALLVDPDALRQRKLKFPFYLIDPLRQRGNIPRWLNPIFARELRRRAFGGGIWIFRGAYLCLAMSVVLMTLVAGNLGRQTPDVIRVVALVFQLGLVVLIVPSLTSTAITQERARANLDVMRLTRVGPLGLMLGKLAAAAVFISFLVIGSLPLWFGIHFLKTNTAGEILTCWSIIGATTLLALMAGLFSSTVTTRAATATSLAYGMVVLVAVATLLPLLARERFSGSLVEVVFSFNPFISAVQALTTGYFQELPEQWRSHVGLTLGLSAVLFVAAWLRVRRMLAPEQ